MHGQTKIKFTDHTFCIRQTLEKKCECNETVHQPSIDCKTKYCSIRREELYNNSDRVWYPHETGKANKNVSD